MAKFDPDLDLMFAALADPTRRAIVARLARGPATVSELAAPHDMALPSFMAHLARLEAAGLVVSEKAGRVRTCRLGPDALRPAIGWLEDQRSLWENRLNRFDAYVTTLNQERKNGPRS